MKYKVIYFMLMVLPAVSIAGNIEQQFVIPLQIQYESNPRYQNTDENAVSKKIVTPRYTATASDDIDTWNVDLSYRIERSSDTEILNDRDDPAANLKWTHELENGSFMVSAHKSEASTRETEVDDTGLVVFDGTRKLQSFSAGWNYNLSDKISFSLGGSRSHVRYENISLVDFVTTAADMSFAYQASERVTPFVSFGKSNYEPDDTETKDELSFVNLGMNIEINNVTTASIIAGETTTKTDVAEETDNNGKAEINVASEKHTLLFSIERIVSPSGLGGFRKANQLRADWALGLSETSNLTTIFSVRENVDASETKTRMLSLRYRKEFNENWEGTIFASRTESEDIAANADAVTNDVIGVSLNYLMY